jgi:hypothetical protein
MTKKITTNFNYQGHQYKVTTTVRELRIFKTEKFTETLVRHFEIVENNTGIDEDIIFQILEEEHSLI